MKIGFIAGCFDHLHDGHKYILNEAKKDCNTLYVGLNSDNYILEKKGRRPDPWLIRAHHLYNTKLVDLVFQFYANPIDLILELKPSVIFVGDDYTINKVIGYPECLEWGGEVKIIPRLPNISTTAIYENLKNEKRS